jgi:hypothetical protein
MTFSLLSTKHVALRTNYNTEIAQHKQPYNPNIIKQDKQLRRVCSTFQISRETWKKDYGLQEIDLRA